MGDVRDTAGNIANGNWGGAALSAVGIIPIAGDILKGGDSAADAARVARRAEIAKRAENLAGRNLAKLEDSIPNVHFAKRHGADTTLEQQYRRATEGVTPDGVEGRCATLPASSPTGTRWRGRAAGSGHPPPHGVG